MEYIDLTLKEVGEDSEKEYILSDIIDKKNITVILGAPGSGKSSILKKYQRENELTEFQRIGKFIELNKKLKPNTKILLLDGLDEYRSSENNKGLVIDKLAYKISELIAEKEELKVAITCREMDWYGESDKGALRDELEEKEVNICRLLPLSSTQQYELIELLAIDNKEEFVNKFNGKGFLENPQMLKMLSNIWKESKKELSSKFNIYNQFLLLGKENNKESKNRINSLDEKLRCKIIGYLAFYTIFSGEEEFNDHTIEKIMDIENGYSRKNLELMVNTSVFAEKRFIHRTIAEFALAKYIKNYKLDDEWSKTKILSLFVKNNRIPTELRGTYAWLCAITQDEELFKVDPYYQAIHGDNSMFSLESKKRIMLSVREYSKENPYFYGWDQRMELHGFYEIDMEDFLINEMNTALKLNNHYMYFIMEIISQSTIHTKKMIEFMKKIISNSNIYMFIRMNFLRSFEKNIQYLLKLLELIMSGEVVDEDEELKGVLLGVLYPEYVSTKQIVKYLDFENKGKIKYTGVYRFLDKTPFKNKFQVVDSIIKHHNLEPENFHLNVKVESFVNEYYLEFLVKKYEEKNYIEIYEFIKHFNSFYPEYYNMEFREKYSYKIKNKKKKFKKLANELYKLFLKEALDRFNSGERTDLYWNFNHFYNFTYPENKANILIEQINQTRNKEANELLFWQAVHYINEDLKIKEKLNEVSKLINKEKELENWLNPPKEKWQIREEKREEIRQLKTKKLIKENEEYIASLSENEKENSLRILSFIADFYYFDDEKWEEQITQVTLKKLEILLERIIFIKSSLNEFTTMDSIILNGLDGFRKSDRVYYSSLILNNDLLIREKLEKNIELKKYLYILCVLNENSPNKNKVSFHEKLEKKETKFVEILLKEFIKKYLNCYMKKHGRLFFNYIENEFNLERLKRLVTSMSCESYKRFLEVFLNLYAFDLRVEDLKEMNELKLENKNIEMIVSLLLFNQDRKEEVKLKNASRLYDAIVGEYFEGFSNFKKLSSEKRVKVLNYLMDNFNTEELTDYRSTCGDFLKRGALDYLALEELRELLKYYENDENIWKDTILNQISKLKQKESDLQHEQFSIKNLKDFILQNSIISKDNFFAEVCVGINKLKTEIEDNRNKEKEVFYLKKEEKKDGKVIEKAVGRREEDCRDIIFTRLNDKFGKHWEIIKEKYEANNRVDINIKYKNSLDFEVQIECKVDDNAGLYDGINNQLIEKYFSSDVQYGIYLVFYFGDLNPKGRSNKDKMIERLKKQIPEEYKGNIEVICINLKK